MNDICSVDDNKEKINNTDDLDILRQFKNLIFLKTIKKLGFGLRKLNYCIKLLQKKGLIKIQILKK